MLIHESSAILGLACLGIYGVITRTIAQRTGEFGIRLALGAQVRDITSLVLTSGAKLALVGSAIGLIACYMPARHASRISPMEALRAE